MKRQGVTRNRTGYNKKICMNQDKRIDVHKLNKLQVCGRRMMNSLNNYFFSPQQAKPCGRHGKYTQTIMNNKLNLKANNIYTHFIYSLIIISQFKPMQ